MMGRNIPWNNHEARLPNALKSIGGLAHEIIFVNTSLPTDAPNKLSEIARDFGAKVYEHPWTDNYSFHRNQTIQYAGKTDWIWIIDCDAEFKYDSNDLDTILYDFTQFRAKIGSVAFPTEDIQHGRIALKFNPARCFRRFSSNKKLPGVKYVRRVHNSPNFKGQIAFYPYVKVLHYGYQMTSEQKQLKHDYMVDLLHKALKDNSQDHECYFYLNQAHSLIGEYDKSIEYGEEYVKRKKDGNRFNTSVYFTLFRAYKALDDKVNSARIVHEGIKRDPNDMDLNLALVELGVWTSNAQLVEKGGENYITIRNKINSGVEDSCVQNKFLLSDQAPVVSFVLENVAAAKLQQGIGYLNGLRDYVKSLPSESKNKTIKEMNLILDTIGTSELKSIFYPMVEDVI